MSCKSLSQVLKIMGTSFEFLDCNLRFRGEWILNDSPSVQDIVPRITAAANDPLFGAFACSSTLYIT